MFLHPFERNEPDICINLAGSVAISSFYINSENFLFSGEGNFRQINSSSSANNILFVCVCVPKICVSIPNEISFVGNEISFTGK